MYIHPCYSVSLDGRECHTKHPRHARSGISSHLISSHLISSHHIHTHIPSTHVHLIVSTHSHLISSHIHTHVCGCNAMKPCTHTRHMTSHMCPLHTHSSHHISHHIVTSHLIHTHHTMHTHSCHLNSWHLILSTHTRYLYRHTHIQSSCTLHGTSSYLHTPVACTACAHSTQCRARTHTCTLCECIHT